MTSSSTFRLVLVISVSLAAALAGCASKNGVEGGIGGSYSLASTGGSASYVNNQGGNSSISAGGDTGQAAAAVWPPPEYTNVTNVTVGAYALGPQVIGGNGATGIAAASCGSGVMYGVVRDFLMYEDQNRQLIASPAGHVDFEDYCCGDDRNITTSSIGADGKPVYASSSTTVSTHGASYFNQWYNDTPGINMTYILALQMVQANNILSFSASKNNGAGQPDSSFFPLDDAGFGNEGLTHNYSFTTEIHTNFIYHGGETFTFNGDDDVFVYINGSKVIDLGGVHNQETQTVTLDTLGLQVGTEYPMDIFNAERHTVYSNFRIDTTLAFTNCGQIGGVIIN